MTEELDKKEIKIKLQEIDKEGFQSPMSIEEIGAVVTARLGEHEKKTATDIAPFSGTGQSKVTAEHNLRLIGHLVRLMRKNNG